MSRGQASASGAPDLLQNAHRDWWAESARYAAPETFRDRDRTGHLDPGEGSAWWPSRLSGERPRRDRISGRAIRAGDTPANAASNPTVEDDLPAPAGPPAIVRHRCSARARVMGGVCAWPRGGWISFLVLADCDGGAVGYADGDMSVGLLALPIHGVIPTQVGISARRVPVA